MKTAQKISLKDLIIGSLFTIVFAAIIFISAVAMGRYFQQKQRTYKNAGYTVCMYTGISVYGGKSTVAVANYIFEVNDERYQSEGAYLKYMVPGEKYMIKYNKDNPKHSEVLIDQPVFLENEPIDSTFAVIKEIDAEANKLDYSYKVGNKIYERSQFFHKKFLMDTIAEFDKFKVYYWVERPGVAKLNIKRRIN